MLGKLGQNPREKRAFLESRYARFINGREQEQAEQNIEEAQNLIRELVKMCHGGSKDQGFSPINKLMKIVKGDQELLFTMLENLEAPLSESAYAVLIGMPIKNITYGGGVLANGSINNACQDIVKGGTLLTFGFYDPSGRKMYKQRHFKGKSVA